MFKKKVKKEVLVTKFIDDLPGMADVLHNARSYGQNRLTDACNNIKFNASEELDPIENMSLQFVFRNFFYIMHQTGLYNPQRRFFTHLASVNRVEVKDNDKFGERAVSDLYFYDIHGKYILVRLEHPESELGASAVEKTFKDANNQSCLGAIYIANKLPDQETINLIQAKTGTDKYFSPINDFASFNFVVYQASADALSYKMVHPDIGKDESASAKVPASLLPAMYDNSASLVG